MSILFPDHVTAYYIPNAVHLYNVFKNFQPDYATPPVLEANAAVTRRRMLEYRYQDRTVVPVASKQRLTDFVTTQTVENHPESTFINKTWCVIEYEYPPDQKKECDYMVAMDQALIEGYDAIIIEPFTVSQRAEQWIKIAELIYSGFTAYLTIAIVATVHCPLLDPAPAFVSLFSIYLLRTYRKYIQGDPIAIYRNFDFDSNEDMNFMYHMSELLDVNARFTNVLIKDVRRDRYRLNIMRGLMITQFFIATYKYTFGIFLNIAFSDRPL